MKLERNVKLAPYTTYRIGGLAKYFVRVKNEDEIGKPLNWHQVIIVPFFVWVGGTILLVVAKGTMG